MLGSMYLYFTIFLRLKTWQYPNCGWKIESQAWSSMSVQLSTGFKSLYNFNSIKSDLGEDNFVISSVWLIFGLWSKRWSLYALDSGVVSWIKWLNYLEMLTFHIVHKVTKGVYKKVIKWVESCDSSHNSMNS